MMSVSYDDLSVIYDNNSLSYDGLQLVDGVGYSVEIAFGYAPLDTSPRWTSVTHLVRGFSTSRGTSSEYASFSPGTATIRLDNRTRVFDPTYVSGSYYGQLNPMTPVRVTASYNGTTHALFTGFVQGWPTTYRTENVDAVTSLPCVDATQILGSSVLPVKYEKVVSEEADLAYYFPLQEAEDNTYTITNTFGTFVNTSEVTYEINRERGFSFNVNAQGRQGEFFDAVAPVQPGKSFQLNDAPPGQDELEMGPTASYEPGTVPLFDAPLKTFELWLYHVNTDRFDSTGRQTLFSATLNSGTINRDTTIGMTINDDGTMYGLSYYTDTVGHTISGHSSVDLVPGSANHIVLTSSATNVQVYINGLLQYDEPFNDTYQTSSGSGFYSRYQVYAYTTRVAHLACYYDTFDAARVTEHYNAAYGYVGDRTDQRLTRALDDTGWPTAWRDLQTGVQTVGAYRAAGVQPSSYMQEINVAEQGNVFVNRDGFVQLLNRDTVESSNIITSFDDSSAHLPFTDIVVDANNISAISNTVTASYRSGSVERQDSASVTAYGIRNESISIGLIDDADDVASIADTIIARKKDPRTIIKSLNVNVRSDTSVLAPVVASLELGDNIAVSFTPTNVGDPLWRAVTIQGISHSVTPTGWNVNMYLVPGSVSTNGPLVVLNDDTYGELDAGNKLG